MAPLHLLDYAAHPVGKRASSRAVPHIRVDDLDVACLVSVHNTVHNTASDVHNAASERLPVDEGQPPQGEAAAALEFEEPGLFLAVCLLYTSDAADE